MNLLDMLLERLRSDDHLSLELLSSGVHGDAKSLYTAWVNANGGLYELDRLELQDALRLALERDWQGLSDILRDRNWSPSDEAHAVAERAA